MHWLLIFTEVVSEWKYKKKKDENRTEGRNCGEYTRNFWNILRFKNMHMWVVNCSIILMGSAPKSLSEMSGTQGSHSFRPGSDRGTNPTGRSPGDFCRYNEAHHAEHWYHRYQQHRCITHVSPGMVQMPKDSLRLEIAMTNCVLEQMLPLSQVLQLTW